MSSRTVVRRKRKERPSVAREFQLTEKDVQAVIDRIGGPSWLADRRKTAWQRYQEMPMPTLQDEPWRRTDIRSMPSTEVAWKAADEVPVEAELLQPLAGGANAAQIVLRPGHDPEIEGIESLTEQGVVFCDWATAEREHSDILKEFLGKVVPDDEGKFSALAAAMAEDGILVYVPKGTQVEAPLHSIVWAPGAGLLSFSRVLVVVEDGASLTYVHEMASPTEAEGSAIHDSILEIWVGDAANVKFVELQNWGQHVWNFTHERSRVGRDANLDWIFGSVGSHLTKTFTELDLVGEGSTGRMSGFYFVNGDQHLDQDTQQNHLAPNTVSDLLFKGALVEDGRSVWQGMIYVAPGAQKTDGYQANRNLILSDKARADSIPGLEILADDVRCTHGATIGQLDEEPIFYLMSRGLPREEAERLVVDGFFAPVMARVPFEDVRSRFEKMIDDKMER
ncbi:MAG: Fe-S cluster assembly protein SufD [Anaerolineales bacterium]